jgi:transposase
VGELVGANPTDRGKPGSKFHLMVDGAGLPLAALVSAANIHDSRLLVGLGWWTGSGRCGDGLAGHGGARCGCTPTRLMTLVAADRRCGSVGIGARIARRRVQSSRRLGRQRWKVERTITWLLEHRRLQVRYERLAAVLEGLLQLACALMCWRTLATTGGGA